MKTKKIRVEPNDKDPAGLEEAAEVIRSGGLVAFPTETVYGLGANALEARAVEKIFLAKGRPQDNPLIVHVASLDMAKECISQNLDAYATIFETLWPGPVTLIFKKSGKISDKVTAGLDSVGIRFPAHPVALKLIELAGVPIAAPSANLSGKPSPTSESHVLEDLDGRIDFILSSGDTLFGLESTIVDLSRGKPSLLRPGPVEAERLRELLPELEIPEFVRASERYDGQALSPGLKYRHYSPEVPLILVEGNLESVISRIKTLAESERSTLLCSRETAQLYPARLRKVVLGSLDDLYGIASSLFRALRSKENLEYGRLLCEPFPERGIGLAIMNRLRKAAWRIERV